MKLHQLLTQAAEQLAAVTDQPTLEAQLLFCHLVKQPRSYCLAHDQDDIDAATQDAFIALIQQRLHHKPLHYLLGEKEFYGLPFTVNAHTLIPRADTECLVDYVLAHFDNTPKRVVDLGTGTGAIACALKYHRPAWDITATDIDKNTLLVAEKNVDQLRLDIELLYSNWFSEIDEQFDLIISNPPYVSSAEYAECSDDVKQEPVGALISNDNGLFDLLNIAQQAKAFLKPTGALILEHGYRQQSQLLAALHQLGYQASGYQDLTGNDRFVVATL